MRKYAEAIPFFLRADSLERLKPSGEVAETTNVVLWIANCYYKYFSSGYGTESVTALIEMSSIKQRMGEVKDAYNLCVKARDIIDKDDLFAEYPGSYAYLLSVLAQAEYGLLMYEEAFEHSSEAKRLFEQDDIEAYLDAYIINEGWRAFISRFVSGCDHPQIVREVYEAFMSSEDFKDIPMGKMVEILFYKCNPANIPLEKRIAAQRKLIPSALRT